MTVHDFSFAAHAAAFDPHINSSIRGLQNLHADCVGLSPRFVQSKTTVVDIGCSTGALLRAIHEANRDRRRAVSYIGIDSERTFGQQWRERRTGSIRFRVCDARSFDFENVSFACSLFTLQFIPERDRLNLLRRVFDGLIEGGALILAEKVLANTAYFQDVLTFDYYDFKRQSFSPEEILDKERSLRGQMILWSEEQWLNTLCEAGFQLQGIHRFWQDHLFVAWVVRKSSSKPVASTIPLRLCVA